jgi:hypothetical protein
LKNEKQGMAWFNKKEEYFEIHGINNDDEKIKYASMQLEGDTYNWYMWWKKTSFLLVGIHLRMNSLKDSKVSKKKIFYRTH